MEVTAPAALAMPHPVWKRRLVFPIGRLICRVFFLFFGRYRVRGAYRVPRDGGVLVLSNHLADIDPMLVQTACPRNLHFMAKSELFDMKVVGPILRIVGCFPVKRGEPDRAALKRAANLTKIGEAVCIFPEGQLSEDGALQDIKAGIALVIRMAESPVICLGIQNTQRIMPYGNMIPRPTFRRLEAVWGEPRTFTKENPPEEVLGWIEGQLRMLTAE